MILAIVYAILNAADVVIEISVTKMVTEIISVTILAFIAGGITFIYQLERLPLIIAILIHALLLYIDYIVIYFMNGWLISDVVPVLVFTGCFILGFALVWLVIYVTTNVSAARINRKLTDMQLEAEYL